MFTLNCRTKFSYLTERRQTIPEKSRRTVVRVSKLSCYYTCDIYVTATSSHIIGLSVFLRTWKFRQIEPPRAVDSQLSSTIQWRRSAAVTPQFGYRTSPVPAYATPTADRSTSVDRATAICQSLIGTVRRRRGGGAVDTARGRSTPTGKRNPVCLSNEVL